MTATSPDVARPAHLRTARALVAAVALALALPAGALAAPSFRGPTDVATGGFARDVAVGDFNGDADPDLAVANQGPDTVSVLLGQAGGRFGAPTDFAAGANPSGIAVADLNGDAHADLAIADPATAGEAASQGVSVLLGDGAGSFSSPTRFPAGFLPFAIAAGDFDGDSDVDLAVTYNTGVAVLLGAGDGTFGAPTGFAAGSGPAGLAVGDFDGDSDPDLAVGNQLSDNVSVLLGDGDGAFGAPTDYTVGDWPGRVGTGDFDGDSDLDLAVVNAESDSVSVLLGDGDGTFGAATDFGTLGSTPVSIAIADFDGDLDPDLAVAHRLASVSVLYGQAGGTFGATTNVVVGDQPLSVTAGDFNGDSEPDLAVSKPLFGGVSVLLENDRPVAAADAYVTDEDRPLDVAARGVLGNDSDPDLDGLTAALVSGPDHGTVTLGADGSLRYTPDPDFNGRDRFTYRAGDGSLDSEPATAEIDVRPVDEAPAAQVSTPPTTSTGAPAAEPEMSRLGLDARCVRRTRSGRVRVGMTLRMAEPRPLHVRIARAVASQGRRACPQANATRRQATRFRHVATLREVGTRPAADGRRRLTLRLRLTAGLYRLSVRAHRADGRLSAPILRYVRVLGG